jgi:tetratricopeptide (TPR) repeat protein
MRWCLERWRGRAALLMILCALASPAFAGIDDGPKKDGSVRPEDKIPDIEDAAKLLIQGKVDEAYKKIQKATAEHKELDPSRLILFRLMLATQIREYQPRLRLVLELAINENLGHPAVYIDNGQVALQEGRVAEAILNCEKSLALAGGAQWTADKKKQFEHNARMVLASAYEVRGNWEAARTQLTSMLAADPKEYGLRVRLAKALFFLEPAKTDDAFQELTSAYKAAQAAKAEDKMDTPGVGMARLWGAKGDNPMAREWFEKAVKADPKNLRVRIAYADYLMQDNNVQQAKLQIAQAAQIKPDDPDVQKFQGVIARVERDLPTAEKTFRAYIASHPGDAFAINQVALVLADEGGAKLNDARDYAELNAKANPKNPEALATLGYVYYQLKNVDAALQALQESARASNGQATADVAYFWALCLKDKDQIEKAKQFLKEAMSVKGLFVYKREAQDLRDKLDKMPPTTTSSK